MQTPEYQLASNQLATPASVGLFRAAESGDVKAVQRQISSGGNPNWFCNPEEGAASLHKAAENGHTDVCEALITGGAVVDEKLITSKSTPLHLACNGGHVGVVRVLLANNASVNLPNAFGNTPLFMACSAKNNAVELVRLLLDNGADATRTNNRLSTPLHFAAYNDALSSADEETIISALDQAGANLDSGDEEGMTALHISARDNRLTFAQTLVNKGASFDVEDRVGKMPVDHAQFKKNEQMMKLLA